jgi:hypothetical protein
MQGFSCVDLRDGSSDSGRDIDAVYRSKAPDGITEINEKWRFECKRYSNGLSFDIISCVVPNVWTLYTPARKLHSLETI